MRPRETIRSTLQMNPLALTAVRSVPGVAFFLSKGIESHRNRSNWSRFVPRLTDAI